jgi:hypothetical protein
MLVKLLPLLLIVCVEMGPYAFAEPVVGFSFLVELRESSTTSAHPKNKCLPNSLRDPFPVGADLVLLGGRIYPAKIACPCVWTDRHGSHEGSALTLSSEEDAIDVSIERGSVAIIGVKPAAVRLISLKKDDSPVPQDVESNARKLIEEARRGRRYNPEHPPLQLSNSSPESFRAEQVVLLNFRSDGGIVPILIVNNDIFLLEGTFGHFFFSVDGMLHLACGWSCVECAKGYKRIYNLSGETPKAVWLEGDDPARFPAKFGPDVMKFNPHESH